MININKFKMIISVLIIICMISLIRLEEPKTSSIKKTPKIEINAVEEEIDNRFDNLVEATIRLETGNRTSYLYTEHNNHGGIKDSDTTFRSYETKEEGLYDLKELLKSYVEAYGYDYKTIREIYCPLVDDECIGDYERFMEVLSEVEGEN